MRRKQPFLTTTLICCISLLSLQCACAHASTEQIQSKKSVISDCHAHEGRAHSAQDQSKECCSKCVADNTAVIQKGISLAGLTSSQVYFYDTLAVLPEKTLLLVRRYFSHEILYPRHYLEVPIAYHISPRSPPIA